MSSQRKRHRRRKRRFRGIPAPVVFFFLVALALGTAGAIYVFRGWYTTAGLASGLAIVIALWVNDHRGFIRNSQMRRAYEARRHFNTVEIVLLIGLIMLNAFVAVYVLVG